MSNLEMWSFIVGFVSPLVIAVVQQPGWSPRLRAIVTFVFSVIVGAATVWIQGDLTGKSVVTSVLIVLVTAISTYKGLWSPTNVAPAIERATSGRHAKAA